MILYRKKNIESVSKYDHIEPKEKNFPKPSNDLEEL